MYFALNILFVLQSSVNVYEFITVYRPSLRLSTVHVIKKDLIYQIIFALSTGRRTISRLPVYSPVYSNNINGK